MEKSKYEKNLEQKENIYKKKKKKKKPDPEKKYEKNRYEENPKLK